MSPRHIIITLCRRFTRSPFITFATLPCHYDAIISITLLLLLTPMIALTLSSLFAMPHDAITPLVMPYRHIMLFMLPPCRCFLSLHADATYTIIFIDVSLILPQFCHYADAITTPADVFADTPPPPLMIPLLLIIATCRHFT